MRHTAPTARELWYDFRQKQRRGGTPLVEHYAPELLARFKEFEQGGFRPTAVWALDVNCREIRKRWDRWALDNHKSEITWIRWSRLQSKRFGFEYLPN